MTYSQALVIAHDRQLFGAQAYARARIKGETRSSRRIFGDLRFDYAMRHLHRRMALPLDSTERVR